MANDSSMPVGLTIAGLDPSGGAGILADAEAFNAFNCHVTAVVTSITFQNSSGVYGFAHQSAETVRAQLLPLMSELPVACIKTGMLPLREIVLEVVRIVREHDHRCLVVDPVMISTSGYQLMDERAVSELRASLIPLARLVTPNIPEAEKLAGFEITDEDAMIRAAAAIRAMGSAAVLIKGGHLNSGSEVIDVLDNQSKIKVFRGERIRIKEFRGSGCRLASAIAAGLANGLALEASVHHARDFLLGKMRRSQSG